MEIEIKPISLEDRLNYISTISENQKSNTKKLRWEVVIASLLIGGVIVYAFMKRKSNPPQNAAQTDYSQQGALQANIQAEQQEQHNMVSQKSLNEIVDVGIPTSTVPTSGW